MDGYLGETKLFAGNYAPIGWMLCAGQLLPISQYSALFAVIGIQFGGNGSSNFQLPDLRGRMAIGAGQGPGLTNRLIGQAWGNESIQLTNLELPTHTHSATMTAPAYSGTAVQKCFKGFGTGNTDPENRYMGPAPSGTTIYYDTEGADMGPIDVEITKQGSYAVNNQPTGASQPFDNMPPWLCMNYIICVNGLWPPRP